MEYRLNVEKWDRWVTPENANTLMRDSHGEIVCDAKPSHGELKPSHGERLNTLMVREESVSTICQIESVTKYFFITTSIPETAQEPEWGLFNDSNAHLAGADKTNPDCAVVDHKTMFGDRQVINHSFEGVASRFEWRAKYAGVSLKFVIETPEQWEAFRGFYSKYGSHIVRLAVEAFFEANIEAYKKQEKPTPVNGFIRDSAVYLEAAAWVAEYQDIYQTLGYGYGVPDEELNAAVDILWSRGLTLPQVVTETRTWWIGPTLMNAEGEVLG